MLLYDSPISGNCYKVRLLMAQLCRPYERRSLDVVAGFDREGELGELNPARRVPTLVLDDGRSLAESNAILWYLAGGSAFLPDDEYARAKVLQWLFFEQYSHEPNIAVVRFLLAYADGSPYAPDEIERRRRAGYEALDTLERELAERAFLLGERYTIADVALYAYTHVAGEGGFELARYPSVQAWLGRVAAQPGHVPIDA